MGHASTIPGREASTIPGQETSTIPSREASTIPGREASRIAGRKASKVPRRKSRRRTRQLEEIAEALPQRASALSKIFLTRTSIPVSRTEVGVLRGLRQGPRRITELAAEERVTQPAITLLVNRLAERGWVERTTDPKDRRAVLVTLTLAGEEAFDRLKAEYRALL